MANTPIVVDLINYTDTFKIWADKCNGLITEVNSTNFVVEEDPVMFLDDSRGYQTIIAPKTFDADMTFEHVVDVNEKLNIYGTSTSAWRSDDNQGMDAGLEVTGTTRIWDEITLTQDTPNGYSNQTFGFVADSDRYTLLATSGPLQTPKLVNTGNFMELNGIHYELPDLPYANGGDTRYGTGGGFLNNPATPDPDGVYYLKNIGTQGDTENDPEVNGGQLTSNNLIWQQDLSDIWFDHDDHQLEHYGPDGELKGDLDIPDYGDFEITTAGDINAGQNLTWTFTHTNSGKDAAALVQQAPTITDLTNFEIVGTGTDKSLRLTTFSGQIIDIADVTGVSVVDDGNGNLSFQVTSLTGENHSIEDFGEIEIVNDGNGNLSLQLTTSAGEIYSIADQSTLTVISDPGDSNIKSLELTSLTGETHSIADLSDIIWNETTEAVGSPGDFGYTPAERELQMTSLTGEVHSIADLSDIRSVNGDAGDFLVMTSPSGEEHVIEDQTNLVRSGYNLTLTSLTGVETTIDLSALTWITPTTDINIFYDSSGSVSAITQDELGDMITYYLKNSLLPYYGYDASLPANDPINIAADAAYSSRVAMTAFSSERFLNEMSTNGAASAGATGVINIVFQDESSTAYHILHGSNVRFDPTATRTSTYNTDIANYRSLVNGQANGFYKGAVISWDHAGGGDPTDGSESNRRGFSNFVHSVTYGIEQYAGTSGVSDYTSRGDWVFYPEIQDNSSAAYYTKTILNLLSEFNSI